MKPLFKKNFSQLMGTGVFLLSPLLLISFQARAESSKAIEKVTQAQISSDSSSKKSQAKISKSAEEIKVLVEDYRMTLKRIENTRAYNRQVETMIVSQKAEAVSIAKQIEELKGINTNIVPLMLKMIDSIESFVQLDTPFLLKERTSRIEGLRKMMARADVSTSEKYRRILEAYQVENEYGRTIEAYRDLQKLNGFELSVDFLRIGRVTLIYQTLDGESSGIYDAKTKSWSALDSGHNKNIQTALRVARKQTAPNLLQIPVPSPEVSL
ncbi:DUF3450 domain-containing protein [Bdellovibrionales bacterium]|nr:DUF3450 domain-containing protein [Bdellovibrionales bacterium]